MTQITLSEFILTHQKDGVLWKADRLLGKETNPIVRNDRFAELARTLALIPKPAAREDYAKVIGKKYGMSWGTFRKLIDDALVTNTKKAPRPVRKNKIETLQGDATRWPFFTEIKSVNKATQEETFKGILIDKVKFVQLLRSFGYTRYETNLQASKDRDNYQFVKLEENVIRSVSRDQIIDYIEKFIYHQYDFEGAGCDYVNPEMLVNKFYDGMNKYFSKDLFARVRSEDPIIVNRDTKDKTFFYYQNGFLEIDKGGWQLRKYDEMDGSVWDSQLKNFELKEVFTDTSNKSLQDWGMFADFMWKVSGQKENRFWALCGITGYVLHDYYEYKLKAINTTDSSLSEASEGRTGKTLWARMLGYVKSYCEINGKDFKSTDERKYQKADLGTQIVHLNDIKTRGMNKFDFEDVFNDITEGYEVRKLYAAPFHHQSKFIFSSNKTLNIVGASQRDRILEYEWSAYFNENKSVEQEYNCWFGRDWDEKEWNKFHNFMAFCSFRFHNHGLEQPESINLGERKLIDHTCQEFIDYMNEITEAINRTAKPFDSYQHKSSDDAFPPHVITEYPLDLNQLYKNFIQINDTGGFQSWLTQQTFNKWVKRFAELRHNVKSPIIRRSGGRTVIVMKEETK